MKKSRMLTIFIIFVTFVMIRVTVSNAASLTISSSKSTANKGDTATITVNGNGISGKIALSVSGSGSISPSSIWVDNSSSTATLKINGTGNVTVTATTEDVSDSETAEPYTKSTSTTIRVKEVTSNNNTNTNSNSNSNNSTKVSSDATLRTLGITPNDFSGFSKNQTSYSVTVPKSVETISIYAKPTDSNAKVTGTGSESLKEGRNTFYVKVTAEDRKTTKTYTLNITRKSEDEVSTDAALTNLGIRPKEYDFTGFKPNTTNYNVEVPNEVEKITIYATAKNSKAQVVGIGEQTLKDGQNSFDIKVTAEDKKTVKTYTIAVTRKAKEENTETSGDNKTGVKDIKVAGYTLTPEFSSEVYSYDLQLPDGTDKLNIEVEASDGIETEVVGNEELKSGKNVITIMTKNPKTGENATYQINANVGNEEVDVLAVNRAIDSTHKGLETRKWIIRGIIIFVIVLILIFLLERYRLTRLDEEIYGDDDEDEEYDDDEFYEENDNVNQNISETQAFYNQMEQDDKYEEHKQELGDPEEFDYEDDTRKRGKYRGRRFK